MGETRNYAEMLPVTPPEGLLDWLREKQLFKMELLVYRVEYSTDWLSGEKEKCVRYSCSVCGGSALAAHVPNDCCNPQYSTAPFGFLHPEFNETIVSGNMTSCPLCESKVRAIHIGAMGAYNTTEYVWPTTFHRVEDKFCVIGWCVLKCIDKNAETSFVPHPYEAYVIEKKKIIRLSAYQKFMNNLVFKDEWEQRVRYSDVLGDGSLVFPWDAKLLKGSTAENSKIDRYLKVAKKPHPVTYLKLWQRYPQLENLIVQGAGWLIGEMIADEMERSAYERPKSSNGLSGRINWKEKRPAQMLGLTKDEFYFFKAQRWGPLELSFYKEAKELGVELRLPEDMAAVKNIGTVRALELLNMRAPVMKAIRYLEKQRARDKKSAHLFDVRYLRDYWDMCVKRNYDLTLASVRWPKSLLTAHDRLVREVETEREKARREKELQERMARAEGFAQRFAALSPLTWESGGLLIRPCRDEEELIAEGKQLDHCVGGYAARHARGETAIFFIRKTKQPDKPFFTLEFDEKTRTVFQDRGKCNCVRTPEVETFEAAWLDWVHAEATKKKTKRKKKEVQVA